ncbi:AAA family ATPase [Vibrio cholerae]|uniref:AAA family ATPase n=1 Tax=Vibrio cholerae TaxID=666 RepID=UPI000BA90F68|nr:AAA family ATPase [Vibrio cholerae]PAR91847.1 hypothetical protein CGT82_18340 [Vibrio cholerae]
MLIYFSAENFRSIKEEVSLDMRTAPRLRRFAHHAVKPLHDEPKLSLLRSALVYGTNASGKSNLVKAIQFVKDCVLSKGKASNGAKSEPFKLVKEIKTESKFYIEFTSVGQHIGFGFSLNDERVLNEYLYLLNNDNDQELCIYERTYENESQTYTIKTDIDNVELEYNNEHVSSSQMSELLLLIKYTSKNKLFLSEAIEKNLDDSMPVLHNLLLPTFYFFKIKLIVIFPETTYGGIHRDIVTEEDGCPDYAQLLNRFDTGVAGIGSQNVDTHSLPPSMLELVKEKLESKKRFPLSFRGVKYNFEFDDSNELVATKVVTTRKIEDGQIITFDLEEESDGTCRLLDLLPAISSKNHDNEDSGKVFVIDEFNRSLHPNISKEFLDIFLNAQTSHPQDQLILTTHESHLLDNELLRRDEIWFVQKEDDQSSSLYSLNDYSERFDRDLRKAYLTGAYGAVPFSMGEYKRG